MTDEIKNEIKGIIYGAGFTVAKVAELLGTSTQNLNQKIARGSIKYAELKEILKVIGYKITIEKDMHC
ncbi:LLM class flavin-dependent oxidoreductase [bacterium]|jgi:hypothetical protein|nr:LLM class flavin-dependent oxidoreductase [bacterium]